MTYHKMKMDEINKIIRDIWRNTYRGNGQLGYGIDRLQGSYAVCDILTVLRGKAK